MSCPSAPFRDAAHNLVAWVWKQAYPAAADQLLDRDHRPASPARDPFVVVGADVPSDWTGARRAGLGADPSDWRVAFHMVRIRAADQHVDPDEADPGAGPFVGDGAVVAADPAAVAAAVPFHNRLADDVAAAVRAADSCAASHPAFRLVAADPFAVASDRPVDRVVQVADRRDAAAAGTGRVLAFDADQVPYAADLLLAVAFRVGPGAASVAEAAARAAAV